ncbi:MAG: transposase zinc-binding domain-containing protein [Bryobacter sp.]|nr:transposase zinc-binding domain-containing protein [Bryobacter sp. CoA8 C33]
MSRSSLELADIFRRHGESYRNSHAMSLEQLKPMRAIETCRTAALGGHVERCGHCAHQRIAYNSFRSRHCPKCQTLAREQWLERRKAELLPVTYYHLVFTLPPAIGSIVLLSAENSKGEMAHRGRGVGRESATGGEDPGAWQGSLKQELAAELEDGVGVGRAATTAGFSANADQLGALEQGVPKGRTW